MARTLPKQRAGAAGRYSDLTTCTESSSMIRLPCRATAASYHLRNAGGAPISAQEDALAHPDHQRILTALQQRLHVSQWRKSAMEHPSLTALCPSAWSHHGKDHCKSSFEPWQTAAYSLGDLRQPPACTSGTTTGVPFPGKQRRLPRLPAPFDHAQLVLLYLLWPLHSSVKCKANVLLRRLM